MPVTRSLRQAARETFEFRELLRNLVQRELRSRYRRSFLGWGWSLLQPALMTAVYAIVLGSFFDVRPAPGDPSGIDVFAIFLLAGVLPWNFFAGALNGSLGSVANAGGLVTRVWFPRELLPLASILSLAVSLLIELAVLTAAVTIATGVFVLQLLPVAVLLVAFQVLFVAGISMWLAACNVRYKDVEYLTSVLLLAYFYLTPILYAPSFIPDTAVFGTSISVRELALANPMARYAMAYRNVFYDARLPGLNTTLWLACWSVFAFIAGFRFFAARADRFAEMM
jgi:lipopolysaccharide transport system permease protein